MDAFQKAATYDSLARRFKQLYDAGKLDTVLFKEPHPELKGQYHWYYHLGEIKVRAKSKLYFALVHYALTGTPVWEFVNV